MEPLFSSLVGMCVMKADRKFSHILLLTAACLTLNFVAYQPHAQSNIILSDDNVVLTGVVTDIRIDDFILQTGNQEYEIDLSRMGLEVRPDEIFNEGMWVEVNGELSDGGIEPELIAESIVLNSRREDGLSEREILMLYDKDNDIPDIVDDGLID